MEPQTPADYEAYRDDIAVLAGLADRLQHETREAAASGAVELRRAQIEERSTRDRLATAAEKLARIEGELSLLVRRAGVAEPAPAQGLRLEAVNDVETFLRGLAADLDAARRSWEWVERAQAREVREAPRASPSSPARASEVAPATGHPTHQGRAPRRGVAIGAVAGVLLLLLIFIIVTKGA